jgi:membrane dipeptidase
VSEPLASSVGRAPLVLDAAVPLVQHPGHLDALLPALSAGGVGVLLPTVASIEDLASVTSTLGAWRSFEDRPPAGARLARSVSDIVAAQAAGELAIVLHVQGLHAVGGELDRLELYAAAGVKVAQLTYNYRNYLADGCLEPANAGLSESGRKAVARLNSLKIIPDVSHTGESSSLEIVEISTSPVIASHSNAKALCDHPRNLSDDLARAVAESGGVVGLCAFPAFVDDNAPTVERLAEHAAYLAELIGAEHVGMGLDFSDEDASDYDFYGYDERYYPRPPWTWPAGLESHEDVPGLRTALEGVGFSGEETDGILGENFLRVFARAWGS